MEETARRSQEELTRQCFLHQTLYELVSTLDRSKGIAEISTAFLPCVMGPLGATSGFVLLRGARQGECKVLFRGVAGEDQHLREGCLELLGKVFPPGVNVRSGEFLPVVLHGSHLAHEFLLPPGTLVLMGVNVADGLQAVVGFGPRLTDAGYGEEELKLLETATRHLALALSRAHQEERITGLNTDLERQNERLARSLKRMEEAGDRLARQSYRMETLYSSALEMSGITDAERLTEIYLLQTLGVLSATEGFAAIFDDRHEAPFFALRGLKGDQAARLSGKEGRSALLGLFVSLKDRLPRHMESRVIEDGGALGAIPGGPEAAVLFAVDESCRGVLCVGRRLSSEPLGEEERQLVGSLATTFLVCLERARAHEKLRHLNEDLAERNEELSKTIADLKSARVQIDLLSETRDRIVSLVRKGLSRADRLSMLDLGAIATVSCLLALLFNFANPSGIPLLPRLLFEERPSGIAPSAARDSLVGRTGVLVDARPEEFFRERRLHGALNSPAGLFDFIYAMRLAELDPDQPIIVYGRTVSMLYDAEVALKLRDLGHSEVYILDGDFPDWEAAGMAVEEGP